MPSLSASEAYDFLFQEFAVHSKETHKEKAFKSLGKIQCPDSPSKNPVPSTSRQLKLAETKIVNQRNVDNILINFVIQSSTFSVVEQPAFQALVQDLQPNLRVMSRTTLHCKIEEGAQEMRTHIKQAMSSIEFIATTADCWSARRGFLGVTAHWVDPDSLKRCSVALACRRIKAPHTFDVLCSALNDIHSEFGIEK